MQIPSDSIGEITLIGTGGGYGESIVVHLGNKTWIIIDSCIDPVSKKCLPLLYLEDIGVNIRTDVKLLICTHWHDDHIRGISQILEAAEDSDFCFAKPNDRVKFLQLLSLDYSKIEKEASNSSTIEFNRCIELIDKRQKRLVLAQENTILIGTNLDSNLRSEVISLSPSYQTILDFDKEISSLIKEFGTINKKMSVQSPNSKSVALFIKLGKHRALLGADLEIGMNENEGWRNILNNSTVIDKKSSLYKIPHHGSETGHHIDIWVKLLEKDPISKLTPWNKNFKLPNPEMLSVICSLSSNVFMTTPVINSKPKKRSKEIEKIISRLNFSLAEIKFKKGIIRSRINLLDIDDKWKIELFENAFHVNSSIE